MAEDFSQANNVADQHPEKLKERQILFYGEARKYVTFPTDSQRKMRLDVALRPRLTLGRNTFTYYDNMRRTSEGTAPYFKNKSRAICTILARSGAVAFVHVSAIL